MHSGIQHDDMSVIMRDCLNSKFVTRIEYVMYSQWPGELQHGELHVPGIRPIIVHVIIIVVNTTVSPTYAKLYSGLASRLIVHHARVMNDGIIRCLIAFIL